MVYGVHSLESPRWGDSNENTQYTCMLKKIENDIPITPSDLALWLTLSSSNYPCLEHNFVVPKVFEPLKFDCTLHQFNNIKRCCEWFNISMFIFSARKGTCILLHHEPSWETRTKSQIKTIMDHWRGLDRNNVLWHLEIHVVSNSTAEMKNYGSNH